MIHHGDFTPVSSGIHMNMSQRMPDAFVVGKNRKIYCWDCGYKVGAGDAGDLKRLLNRITKERVKERIESGEKGYKPPFYK
jgi:hypothetical protein